MLFLDLAVFQHLVEGDAAIVGGITGAVVVAGHVIHGIVYAILDVVHSLFNGILRVAGSVAAVAAVAADDGAVIVLTAVLAVVVLCVAGVFLLCAAAGTLILRRRRAAAGSQGKQQQCRNQQIRQISFHSAFLLLRKSKCAIPV